MTPETKLADYARRVHLQDDDVDYLLSLLQEARGLGSLAGAAAERERIRQIILSNPNGCPHCGLGKDPDCRMRMLAEEIESKPL